MSVGRIALYTDEDVSSKLALALRVRGYDALSCLEAKRSNRNIPDPEQLAFATEQGRVILTFNARDYVPLDHVWQGIGREHAGIVLASQTDNFGELLRRVELHLQSCDPAVQHNCLLWLP